MWGISIGDFASAAGPLGPGLGSDVPVTGGVTWSNPTNIEVSDGVYASASVGTTVATSAGPNPPAAENTSGPDYIWTSISNVEAQDGVYAQVQMLTPGSSSNPLNANNYGFSIPLNAVITGVQVDVWRAQLGGTSAIYDSNVNLLGVPGATGYSGGGPWTGSDTDVTYGGSSTLWGTTITPSMVNSSAFGATITVNCTGAPGNGATAGVDYISITVYYNAAVTAVSDYLEATTFGFSLPTSDIIAGIKAQIQGYQSATATGASFTVQLLKNGNPVGTPKTGQILPGSDGYITVGSSTDLWGTSWTFNDINGVGFGLLIQVINTSGTTITWNVDYVDITIYSSGGGGPTVTQNGSGAFSAVNGGYSYKVAYGNSSDGHVSNSTPPSQATGNFTNISYLGVSVIASTDPQVNQIWVFRTTDGGNTWLNLPTSPYPNVTTTIHDNSLDSSLNTEEQAPLAPNNNPPQVGLINLCYHAGRMWGSIGNVVYCSGGPDTLLGNGNEAWPPANAFVFPTNVTKLSPDAQGLLVHTTSDLWIIAGTSIATFYPIIVQEGLGLLSRNAADSLGSLRFMFTADKQFVMLSSAGFNEIGANIGDLLETYFDPSKAYVAALISGTRDKAVFICDGAGSWYRCNWNQPTEGLPAWSPKAILTNGATAIAAAETSPGVKVLLIGQPNGLVVQRSLDTFTDNGTKYTGFLTLGSLVLTQPGQIAHVESITVELPNIGTAPSVGVLLQEVSGTFQNLPTFVQDPYMIPASSSVMSNRFYLNQSQKPVVCRHLQVQVSFVAEAVKNELWTLSIWGALKKE